MARRFSSGPLSCLVGRVWWVVLGGSCSVGHVGWVGFSTGCSMGVRRSTLSIARNRLNYLGPGIDRVLRRIGMGSLAFPGDPPLRPLDDSGHVLGLVEVFPAESQYMEPGRLQQVLAFPVVQELGR